MTAITFEHTSTEILSEEEIRMKQVENSKLITLLQMIERRGLEAALKFATSAQKIYINKIKGNDYLKERDKLGRENSDLEKALHSGR
jgi:hypothetical protein